MEGGAKTIPHLLKNDTIMRFDRCVQNIVMPLTQSFPLIGKFLGEFRTAFDIGE